MALRTDDKNAYHWLWFARRLAAYYVITLENRIERAETDHVKEAQEKMNLRQIVARDFIDAIQRGLHRQHGSDAKLGKVFILPEAFAGSRKYYQAKYANLMTMCRQLGNPTWYFNIYHF